MHAYHILICDEATNTRAPFSYVWNRHDITWGLTWSLTSSPAQAHSISAKHQRNFLQIVDYFAVLCKILMICVSEGSAFMAIILLEKCAYSKIAYSSWHFVQQSYNFTFFQWNEFGPSPGLTAGLGSVPVSDAPGPGDSFRLAYGEGERRLFGVLGGEFGLLLDWFLFTLGEGERWLFRVLAGELGMLRCWLLSFEM